MNSCVLAYSCFKRTLPGALIALAISLVCVGLLPFSMVYIVVILFSLNSLISNFFVVKPIEEQVLGIKDPVADTPDETAEEDNPTQPDELPEWEEEEGDN